MKTVSTVQTGYLTKLTTLTSKTCFGFSLMKNTLTRIKDLTEEMTDGYWLCADPSEVPRVMRTKFPATVMVLAASSEGHVIHPIFFQSRRINAAGNLSSPR